MSEQREALPRREAPDVRVEITDWARAEAQVMSVRMAVAASLRGKGVGGVVLEALVAEAARTGLAKVALNAQVHALAFYRRHGFVEYGDVFMEAGIPHRAMRRTL